jgi:hypothetical protein
MAKKAKASSMTQQRNQDRHLAFMAYQFGFTRVWFPGLARHSWATASPDICVPPALELHRLLDLLGRLRPLIPDRGPELALRVGETARRCQRSIENAWCGERHRRNMRQRDMSEPEFYSDDSMLEGSPFSEVAWEELDQATEAFTTALTGGVVPWVRLGAAIATVLDPGPGGTQGLTAFPALQNQFSEMSSDPLLAGISIVLCDRWYNHVADIDQALRHRFTDNSQPAVAPLDHSVRGNNTESLAGDTAGPTKILSKETMAIAYLSNNPAATDAEIANLVGCARTSLYRMPSFRELKRHIQAGKGRIRRGHRSLDKTGRTDVDGVDDGDPGEDE